MACRGIVLMLLLCCGWASPCWSQNVRSMEDMIPMQAESKLTFVNYDYQSLLVDHERNVPDFRPLIQLIQRFVAPESWETQGGKGRIFGVGGSLLVYQDSQAHLEISRFTQLLKFAQTKSLWYRGRMLGTQFSDFALEAFPYYQGDRSMPFALVYPIRDLPQQPLAFTTDRDPADRSPGYRTLAELLKTIPAADSWEEQGGVGSILHLPVANCLIIVQRDPQHRQIVEFLGALRTNRQGLGLFNSTETRIIEYALVDIDTGILSTEQLRDVAVRLQDELKNLQWAADDRFIIVDQKLAISQTIQGHAAVKAKFAKWGLRLMLELPTDATSD
ncbi:hypothetical protein [Blastopirellula marina]|uniref:Uncharacterized protein n=1 Tax=Blastopirellula marina DSM 3645 TaxID=314230 RepID=A4A125_9BACT|nr:hypothetical protein [Blastopirellula marina]EAQ77485.1 hypothetical protein DSM3645_06479 [Blastopirellula marina DSM 3645]